MCDRVYGTTTPGVNTKPKVRSGTVKNWKKSMSYFFNTEAKWNVNSNTGNPTQSKKINGLIKSMIKHETRNDGAESKGSQAFTSDEFKQIVSLVPED